MRILVRLIRQALLLLLLGPGGWLAMASGLGQGPAMVQLLEKHPAYDRAEAACDADGAVLAQAAT